MATPPPVMTREEFIDSLWTDERRDDAYKVWDWIAFDPTRLVPVDIAFYLQEKYDDSYGWRELTERWAAAMHFTSEPDCWSGVVAMTTGGVRAFLRQ